MLDGQQLDLKCFLLLALVFLMIKTEQLIPVVAGTHMKYTNEL